MDRVCPVCGKVFKAPPSSKKVTCSRACSSIRKAQTHQGVSNAWGEEARRRKSAQGQTDNLRKGTPAAMASPISGRGESNRNALVWALRDPTGNTITVRNLQHWARENCELFGETPGDKSADRIAHGFYQVKRSMEGKLRRRDGTPCTVNAYKGWSVDGWETAHDSR